jgi:hypothetical protein
MFQLSLKEVILLFDGVFALRLWIHDIYQASAKEKHNWKAIFIFKRDSSMKRSDLFSGILCHSSMKQHDDILIDIVQSLQSFVSTSEALSTFYGLNGQIKNIGLKLFYIYIKCGRCNITWIVQPMGLNMVHTRSEEEIDG